MPTVDGAAAARTLLGFGTNTPGYCLAYVWRAYAVHGATSATTYPTAYAAWLGSGGQHPGDMTPPEGVPVYLGPRSGGSNPTAGDVAISLGGGQLAATDWPRNGVVGSCSIQERLAQTGRPYLGWTDNILGNPIALGGGIPPSFHKGDSMILIETVDRWENGALMRPPQVIAAGYIYWPPDPEAVTACRALVDRTLVGNARQYDLWVAAATQGTVTVSK